MLRVKDVIDSKYEIKEKLGDGLFRAIDMRLMTTWTIKEILLPETDERKEMLDVLEELRKVNHVVFPKIVEIIQEENRVLVVMESISGYCAGELEKEKRKIEIIIHHALELCEGLSYFSSLPCGKKVVWRLEPKEVFIDGGRVRMQDFSIVKEKDVQKELKDILCYMKETLGEELKKIKKFNQRIEEHLKGENHYTDYHELSEELERQLMEYNQTKKLHKLLIKAGMIVAIVGCVGLGAWKVISIMKPGTEQQAASASVSVSKAPTKDPEKTRVVPKEKKKENPKSSKPRMTEKIPTPKPEKVPEKKKIQKTKKPITEISMEKTPIPIIQTKQPSRFLQTPKQVVEKKVPATRKPKKSETTDTLEINIEEESNMEIQIED